MDDVQAPSVLVDSEGPRRRFFLQQRNNCSHCRKNSKHVNLLSTLKEKGRVFLNSINSHNLKKPVVYHRKKVKHNYFYCHDLSAAIHILALPSYK